MVRKKFVVVAYDITSNKRRKKVSDRLARDGNRVNLSVFEVLVTQAGYEHLQADLAKVIKPDSDTIIYYPLCLDCIVHIERTGVGRHTQKKGAVLSV